MISYDYQKIFYTIFANAVFAFISLFYFFQETGDAYMMKDNSYTEAICLPGNNAWHVEHCTLAMPTVTSNMEPIKCYYNKACKIYFKEPKTFPIWFWMIVIVYVFLLTWFAPSPSNMQHWKKD